MNSSRLWHYVAVLLIVVAILSLSIKHIFVGANKWGKVSAQSLQQHMQKGLVQIYWQWQQNGRPDVITYQPDNLEIAIIINMSPQGLPVIAASKEACETMLSWFVVKKAFNNLIKVSTSYSDISKNASPAKDDNAGVQDSCKFEYAGYVLLYNTLSGDLTFR